MRGSWALLPLHDTLSRIVLDRCDNQENLVWGTFLKMLGERASSFPNLGIVTHLVLGTSLHPAADWALGQAPSSLIQPFSLGQHHR